VDPGGVRVVATVEPRVEIDDRIRENPALLEAATQTMAYLGQRVTDVPLPAAIRWRFVPLDPSSLELLMSDTTDLSDMVARRVFRVTQMDDAYTREVGIGRAFGELLRLRSKKRWERIDRIIQNIDLDADAD
jgi:hypothetical protein